MSESVAGSTPAAMTTTSGQPGTRSRCGATASHTTTPARTRTNAAFFAGNVGEVVEELLERSGPPDVVVVDPPRAGLAGKALLRLGRIGAPRLVYVSCNPTTLAGDTKALRDEYGYELRRVTPVDMFPHTPHVECVALLERAA